MVEKRLMTLVRLLFHSLAVKLHFFPKYHSLKALKDSLNWRNHVVESFTIYVHNCHIQSNCLNACILKGEMCLHFFAICSIKIINHKKIQKCPMTICLYPEVWVVWRVSWWCPFHSSAKRVVDRGCPQRSTADWLWPPARVPGFLGTPG